MQPYHAPAEAPYATAFLNTTDRAMSSMQGIYPLAATQQSTMLAGISTGVSISMTVRNTGYSPEQPLSTTTMPSIEQQQR